MSFTERKVLPTRVLWPNSGQINGLPANPRFIKDEKYEKLKQSIKDDPELLDIREIVVIPYADEYVIIGGNMRFRACIDVGIIEVPCKILPVTTPVEKLKAFLMKDNIAYGSTDWDMISNEWDEDELRDWGMDLPVFIETIDDVEDEPDNVAKPSSISRITIELTNDHNKELIKAHVYELLREYPEASIK